MSNLTTKQTVSHILSSFVLVNILGIMCMVSLAWAIADPVIGGVVFLSMFSLLLSAVGWSIKKML